MLWQLPASVRSLALPASAQLRRRYGVTARLLHDAPLRILFCGSDAFSIASLRALHSAKCEHADLIASIEVAHRPAKLTGRGLKTLHEVPIRHVAEHEFNLPTHIVDTFTGWTPPSPIDLIIAVSFGLLVPSRILRLTKHGGLNVHPSLLPDLRGPAPIEHAILSQRKYTGVSVQTLHPQHFDQGTVLAQTPAPGIPIYPDTTASALQEELASAGARMLVDVLKHGKYRAPHEHVAWYAGPTVHAPKIVKDFRRIDFATQTLEDILRVQNALGDPWCMLPNGQRVILHKIIRADEVDNSPVHAPGLFLQQHVQYPALRAACGNVGYVVESTYAGLKARHGNDKLMRVLARLEHEDVASKEE